MEKISVKIVHIVTLKKVLNISYLIATYQKTWRYTSDKVHFDITWKIIVIGFYVQHTLSTTFFPSLLSRCINTK